MQVCTVRAVGPVSARERLALDGSLEQRRVWIRQNATLSRAFSTVTGSHASLSALMRSTLESKGRIWAAGLTAAAHSIGGRHFARAFHPIERL